MDTIFYHATDVEALAVLIRYAESQGAKTQQVRPYNDGFAVEVLAPHDFEITNQTNFRGCLKDVEQRRTYWENIMAVDESCIRFFEVFN